jgi:prepilin-type N-terminal cleavage/methylation domain-containing protein
MKFVEGETLGKCEMKRFNQTILVHCCRQILTDRRGFSLGEILIAAGIFSILAAIAVPQFIAFQPKIRLNGATRQIFSELMWARSKAVMENKAYLVTFPTTSTMVIFDDVNTNGTLDSGEAIKTVNLQTEYAGVTLASTATPIMFTSRGTVSVAPNITLTCSIAGTKTIALKITGVASIS